MHSFSSSSNKRDRLIIRYAFWSIVMAWALHEVLAVYHIDIWFLDTPSVVGFYYLLYELTNSWLWRVKAGPFSVTDLPDLRGTWAGYIRSTRDEAQYTPAVIYVFQDWTRILVRLETRTSYSVSTMAVLNTNDSAESGLKFEYLNEPTKMLNIETMRPHRGVTHLQIAPGAEKMEGHYYTNGHRSFSGLLIDFRLLSRKQLSFEDAIARLPDEDRVQWRMFDEHGENIAPPG